MQDTLTVKDILSLYAPLAGIVGLAFWTGVLSQKIADVVRRVLHLEGKETGDNAVIVQLAQLEERINGWGKGQEKLERSMSEVQRTIANMTSGRRSSITKFEQD